MPYAALDEARETLLRLEANDWGAVEARLRRRCVRFRRADLGLKLANPFTAVAARPIREDVQGVVQRGGLFHPARPLGPDDLEDPR